MHPSIHEYLMPSDEQPHTWGALHERASKAWAE